MQDYRFAHAPTVRAGRIVLRVVNFGAFTHELSVVPLPRGFPPIAQQLRSSVRRPLPALANVSRAAGEERRFAVDLAPGRYAFLCFLPADDGTTHALKGMATEVRVR